MADFMQTLRDLDRQFALSDVILPFLLVFTFIFAILQKTKILGEDKKNLSIGVALVVGLLFVIPHVTGNYPADKDPVTIINNAIPQVSIIVIAVVFLLILIGVFGQDFVLLGASMPGWIAIISIIAIVVIFGGAAGWWQPTFQQWLLNAFGTEALSIVIMILVFGIVVALITGEGKSDKTLSSKMGIDFNKLFGKK